MTNKEYAKYVRRRAPSSKLLPDMAKAFLTGGTICALGQALRLLFTALGAEGETAGALVSTALIFLSALLTGLGVYDKLAKFGGAGTLVPITGYANAVTSPALEFKAEGFITGMAAKMFVIAGPVIVFGVSASAVYGVILWLCTR